MRWRAVSSLGDHTPTVDFASEPSNKRQAQLIDARLRTAEDDSDVLELPLTASTMGRANGKTMFCLLSRRRFAHGSFFLPHTSWLKSDTTSIWPNDPAEPPFCSCLSPDEIHLPTLL